MLKTVTAIAFNIHSTLTPPAVWLRPMRLLLVLKYCKGFLTTLDSVKNKGVFRGKGAPETNVIGRWNTAFVQM